MTDARRIAVSLSDAERDTLLLLTGEGEHRTIPLEAAVCLRERGLALLLPDGHLNISQTAWEVVDALKAA